MELARAMKKHGKKPQDVADGIGVGVAMVKSILRGERLPHPSRVPALLKMFHGDVTRDDIYSPKVLRKRKEFADIEKARREQAKDRVA